MSVIDVLQLIANCALLALTFEPLRLMRRHSSHLRGFVFVGVAVAAIVGILAALEKIPDSNADTLAALVMAMLLIVGCRPVTRPKEKSDA